MVFKIYCPRLWGTGISDAIFESWRTIKIPQILKQRKSTLCGHLMPSFDTPRYCYKCKESGKGDDLCMVKKDCLLCVDFSEDQKRKLTEKLSKGKKSVKETALQKEKDKMDDSILDEEDSTIGMSSHFVVAGQKSGSNSKALAAILSQLTTLLNRIAVIEGNDSPIEADICAKGQFPVQKENCVYCGFFRRVSFKTAYGGKPLYVVCCR